MGQNIVIKPNKDGVAEQPKIDFVGANAGASGITLKVLGDSGLSFEGTSGQLFSINNNLSTGKIFSVNDISGIPSIDVDADGTVRLNPFNGTVYSNTLKAYGPISGTGAGNSLTIAAGNGVGAFKGGDIILQPGAQGSGGGDGSLIVKGQFISLGDFGSGTSIYFGGTKSGTYFYTGGGNASLTIADHYGNPCASIGGDVGGGWRMPRGGYVSGTYNGLIGVFGVGTSAPTATLHVVNSTASTKALIVQGAASQTANLQEWQNSAGTVLASVDAAGKVISNALAAIPVTSGLTASVTAASSSGGILTYTATNTFTVGRTVSVTGLGITSGATLNIAGMTIATASATQFTVVNDTVGVSSGTGTATAGGNTIATSASNAVTAGPGGNYTITAGSGVGVGKGGDIILQPGAQGSSGGNGGVFTTGLLTVNNSTGSAQNTSANARFFVINSAIDYTINEWNGAVVSRAFITPRSYIEGSSGDIVAGSRLGFQNTGVPSPNNAATQMAVYFRYAMRGVMGLWGIPTAYGAESGGSFHFPSATTAIAANTNDLALPASAFQRLNCTAPSNLTGVAPPSGIIHTDGRMIRIFNTGTANLTLTHNSGLSTAYSLNVSAGNRFWNVTAADIILAPNDYAELIYDIINNGSGASGWRAS